jgi:hypothetical protein
MNAAILYHYRKNRACGQTAEAALSGARHHLYFMERLNTDLKAYKNRSKAAKRGWKKRRAREREFA